MGLTNIDLTKGKQMSGETGLITLHRPDAISRLNGRDSLESVYITDSSNIIQTWNITSSINRTSTSSYNIDDAFDNTISTGFTQTYVIYNDDWFINDNLVTTTSIRTPTSNKTITTVRYKNDKDTLSRLIDDDVYISYSTLGRFIDYNVSRSESSIDRLTDDKFFNALKHHSDIDRFIDDEPDHDDRVSFLKREYVTNNGHSFDNIEYNLDMAIAKERLDEYLQDSPYIIGADKIPTISKGEVEPWIRINNELPLELPTLSGIFA